MDFIDFEADVDHSDDGNSFISSDDDNNDSFIDDAFKISESVCEHYTFQNVEVNIDNVSKNPHEKAKSDIDDPNELTNFSNRDLAEELPETVTFCGQRKRVSEFQNCLVIPHDVGSMDSFFMQFVMQFVTKK